MDEKKLVEGCIAGKPKCQQLLYQRFAGAMMNICLRYSKSQVEAEDALQEAFVKVFLHLHQFRFESSLGSWIKKLTVNVLLTKIRRKTATDFTVEITGYEEWMPAVMIEKDPLVPMDVLMKMINDLPDGYKAVFNLREIDGFEFPEIAKMLNCEQSTVRSQLFKAKNRLKDNIETWLIGENI